MIRIAEIEKTIEQEQAGGLLRCEKEGEFPLLWVEKEQLVAVLRLLRDRFDFESLMCETAADKGNHFDLIYHLFCTVRRETLVIKTEVPRGNPQVETAEEVWSSANWYEREIFDLFGVEFIGHSDLSRILLPPDWVGHPLRKDYSPAAEYHGMKIEF
ncbi:MAG: NADH-quinone oxidoreductase subunit C [Deltaproteobacteria bacterium]|nr:NADH-quinone oxidoreductase subunit C [Deltaproteobacteria bacterium]